MHAVWCLRKLDTRRDCALTLDVPDWQDGGLKGGIVSPISPEGSSTDRMPETIGTCISWGLPRLGLSGSRPGLLMWTLRGRNEETYSSRFSLFYPVVVSECSTFYMHTQHIGNRSVRGS